MTSANRQERERESRREGEREGEEEGRREIHTVKRACNHVYLLRNVVVFTHSLTVPKCFIYEYYF